MFKVHMRNPQSHAMEVFYMETATEAEAMIMKAWPDWKIVNGQVIVEWWQDKIKWPGHVYNDNAKQLKTLMVARVEFTDEK